MLKRSKQSTIGRGFETLESRQMMAADVSNVKVEYVGSTLTFTGDRGAVHGDAVIVERISDSQIRVRGTDPDFFGPGSQINGSYSAKTFPWSNTSSMTFDMKGGNDLVRLSGTSADYLKMANLTVKTGGGSDTVSLGRVKVYDATTIATDDLFAAAGTGGQDEVRISNTLLGQRSFSIGTLAKTKIETGEGKDRVDLSNVYSNDEISIDTANSGTDSSADRVSLLNVVSGYQTYHYKQGQIVIKTGKGADTITLKNTKADFIKVDALAGNDTVNFESVLFDNYGSYVNGGTGVDKIRRVNNVGDGLNNVKWQNFETIFT